MNAEITAHPVFGFGGFREGCGTGGGSCTGERA
jgi:hypothetical protein